MRKKSIGIFMIFAEQGIIDNYLFFLAEKLSEVIETLVITINGKPNQDSLIKLKNYTNDIYIRGDEGMDSGAYKDTLENYLGWERIKSYQELLLVNDTCYGPIYPLQEVYEEMDKRALDFWGLTEQPPIQASKYNNNLLPHHIQPYFIVIREKMLHSESFRNFWQEIRVSDDYSEAIAGFELKFTKHFNSLGYKSGAYIDYSYFNNATDEKAYIMFDCLKLVSIHRCPLIKKKVFGISHDVVLSTSAGETAKRTLDYITNETDYNEDLIWQHLIRKCEPGDLRTALHLDYCISNIQLYEKKAEEKKALLIAYISNEEMAAQCFEYIKRIPFYIDIIITSNQTEKIDIISNHILKLKRKNIKLVIDKDKGREINALLLNFHEEINKYEYLCFVHDEVSSPSVPVHTVGQSYMDILWENTISDDIYIENILNLLESNKRLGFLCPPVPYISKLFNTGIFSWTSCFQKTKELCQRLSLSCNIQEDKPPFALGNTFWCKTDALRPLFEYPWSYKDFNPNAIRTDGNITHAIERIFSYVVQSQGYYSGVIMTQNYASTYTCNYQYMLNSVIRNILLKQMIYTFDDVKRVNVNLLNFCEKYKKLYIYGAGAFGHECKSYLRNRGIKVLGYLVSDGKRERNLFQEEVYELSEIELSSETGIIIALNKENSCAVKQLLVQKEIDNYISYEAEKNEKANWNLCYLR